MSFYGDPADMRQQAVLWRTEASEVRHRAGQVRSAVASTQWHSTAATAYRDEVSRVVAHLQRVADELDEAARRLEHHAHVVEERIAAIHRFEHAAQKWFRDTEAQVAQLVDKAESLVSDGISMLGHAVGVDIPKVPWLHWPWRPGTLPMPGDMLWLEVADDLRGRGVPLP